MKLASHAPAAAMLAVLLAACGGSKDNTVKLGSIAVTPGTSSIAKGSPQQLVAIGSFSDGTTEDLTSAVTWSSSAAGVATVSNATGSKGVATGVSPGSATITASLSGVSGGATLTVTSATLVSVAVTPPSPVIAKGTTQQFAATGTYSDGTTQDLTPGATWTSSGPAATVSNAAGSVGLASAASVGSATIAAAFGGLSGGATLTVTSASLISIAVTPATPSIAKGTTQQLVATGTFTDGSTQDLSSSASWTSSAAAVTVSNAAGSKGLAFGASAGSADVGAAFGGVSGKTTLTVTSATLVSLAVTPVNPTLAYGVAGPLTATGTFSDGTTQNLTGSASWVSSNTAVATVASGGASAGVATPVAPGSTTITATSGSVSGTASLTVTGATLVGLAVAPSSSVILPGHTLQLAARATYSDGVSLDVTAAATWSTGNAAVATVSNATGSKGLATATTAAAGGATALGAAFGGLSGSMSATVPLTVAGGLNVPQTLAIAGSTLYFSTTLPPNVTSCYSPTGSGDAVMRVPSDGSAAPTKVDDVDHFAGNCGITGIVSDSTFVYWLNYADATTKKTRLDGTGGIVTLWNGGQYGASIAIDPASTSVFWYAYAGGTVNRIPLPGGGSSTAITPPQGYWYPGALAADATSVYYTDYNTGTPTTGWVYRVPLGGGTPVLMASNQPTPHAPVLGGSSLYWLNNGTAGSNYADGALMQVPIAGGTATTLASALQWPTVLAVDATYAYVLSVGSPPNFTDGRIYKVPLAGGAPTVMVQGLYQPQSIAVDGSYVYWANDSTTTGGVRNSDGTIMRIPK